MVKKLILLATSLLICFTVNAANYQEGRHYKVIPDPIKVSSPEVREYFSYYCGACKGFETLLPELMRGLGDNTSLEKTHVDFMGATSAEVQFMLAKALLVAEQAGIDKKFSSAIFKYLQVDRGKIDDEKDIRDIYVLNGGDGAFFDKAMKSFSVVGKAKRNKKLQDELSKARLLTSVPTFVVNGKYVINAKALDRKDFVNDYKNILKYLSSLDY